MTKVYLFILTLLGYISAGSYLIFMSQPLVVVGLVNVLFGGQGYHHHTQRVLGEWAPVAHPQPLCPFKTFRQCTSASHAHGCTGRESVTILCRSSLKALPCAVEENTLVWSEVRVLACLVGYRCGRVNIKVHGSRFPAALKTDLLFLPSKFEYWCKRFGIAVKFCPEKEAPVKAVIVCSQLTGNWSAL